MDERCRCGAELLPTLHFCAGCGRDRAPVSIPRPRTGAPVSAPVSVPAQRTGYPAAVAPAIPAQRGPVGPARSVGSVNVVGRSDVAVRRGPAVPAPRAGAAPMVPPPVAPRPSGVTAHVPYPGAPRPSGPWAPIPAQAARASRHAWTPAHPQPVAPTRRSATPWVAAALLLVPVLLAGAVLLVLRPGLLPGTQRAAAPISAPATTPFTTPAAVAPATGGTTTSPEAALADQVTADAGRVDATVGYWVPQLSSKRPGTGDGGVTYDAAAILGHYRGLAARYPGAALLWSGDWPVFRNGDYWVVVVAEPFGTASAANAWCDAQGFGADDCFAKQLSRTGGSQGTTVHR